MRSWTSAKLDVSPPCDGISHSVCCLLNGLFATSSASALQLARHVDQWSLASHSKRLGHISSSPCWFRERPVLLLWVLCLRTKGSAAVGAACGCCLWVLLMGAADGCCLWVLLVGAAGECSAAVGCRAGQLSACNNTATSVILHQVAGLVRCSHIPGSFVRRLK